MDNREFSLTNERERLTRYRERVATPSSGALTELLGCDMLASEGDWIATRIRSAIIGEIDVMLANINSEIDSLPASIGA